MSKRNDNTINIDKGILGEASGTVDYLRVQRNGVMYMLTDKQIKKRENNRKKQ